MFSLQDSDSEEGTADETVKECHNEFCSLGCVCDSLKCQKKSKHNELREILLLLIVI